MEESGVANRCLERIETRVFAAGFGKEQGKAEDLTPKFMKILWAFEQSQKDSLFLKIVDQRIPQIEKLAARSGKTFGNLAEMFESKEARITEKTTPLDLPDYYSRLEAIAGKLFGNILECWTEFEIFQTIKNAEKEFSDYMALKPAVLADIGTDTVPLADSKAEMVEDISKDNRFFTIENHDFPLMLSNAVVLLNLMQFVKGQKWFEMLKSLDRSRKGRHFILYQVKAGEKKPNFLS